MKRLLALSTAVLFSACLGEVTSDPLAGNAAFVQVSRDAVTGLATDGGTASDVTAETFYVAVNKAELNKKWFMSAFLTQWAPAENIPVKSLGTRVVSFKVQNGKLYAFDVADGKGWSDTLDPTVVIEAWPIVTTDAAFNKLPNAANYVLFDPSAGLNRFSFVSDSIAQNYYARFQVDLSYLQRFRELADGVSFDEVFTGYTEVPAAGLTGFDQPFRASGTLSLSLRRYAESPGFTPRELKESNYFASSNVQYVRNQPAVKVNAVKWSIAPGMTPIPWRISKDVAAYASDPRLAGVDVAGAITRGITSWNQAFGFPVFTVVPTGPDDNVGDDEKNMVQVDRNPGAGYAFANFRENPNTGEIRGASVYFSAAFIEGALVEAGDAGVLPVIDAGVPVVVDAGFDAGLPPPPPPVADAGLVTCSPNVIISQVFGGNGATFAQDFVELHNRSASPLSLAGWSLQYGSSTGTSWQVVALSGTIAPGGFFLVGFAGGADGGSPVHADVSSAINLSASAGKVALMPSMVANVGACPTGAIDFVGYGAANCSEVAATPVPGSTLSVIRRDAQSCVDSNNNAADFLTGAPAPRTSASMPLACSCVAPVAPTDGGVIGTVTPVLGLDGGFALVASNAPAATHLSWDAMPHDQLCALGQPASYGLPAGVSRSTYIESIITEAIAHEIGHTLGLRHNFRGSLTGSSVMDYLGGDDRLAKVTPGPYDVDAVRYLYGLSPTAPAQPFCTDDGVSVSADCDLFDTSANPLTLDLGPAYTAKVNTWLAGQGSLTLLDLFPITRYVRGPTSEAQRLEAFNVLLGVSAPPMAPAVTAQGATAIGLADALTGVALSNLFLDPPALRDGIQVDPGVLDDTFRARVIEVAKNELINSDQHRGFVGRRTAIDVLKALQSYDAYQALLDARTSLATERATYNPLGQAMIDDLSARIQLAVTPYFR